jgi:hypothetical protein
MTYLRGLGWRWLGLAAYLIAASFWYYATTTFLNSYDAVCKSDHHTAGIAIYSVQNFLVWGAPLLIARSRAAILFSISSHNAPECMTKDNMHIDSSGGFEFSSIDELSTFISYLVAIVDVLRWKRSKMRATSQDGHRPNSYSVSAATTPSLPCPAVRASGPVDRRVG